MDGPMTQTLQGKTIVITGAGGGLGRATALAVAAAGANVVILARRQITGDETADLISAEGGSALSVQVDVSVESQLHDAIDLAAKQFGGLDVVIHNAASNLAGIPAAVDHVNDESWEQQFGVGLDAAYYCAKAAFPHFRTRGQGRYILMGSCYGLHGAAVNPVYAAIKGAARGFVKALAREWGKYQINVNLVVPVGLTDMAEEYFSANPGSRDKFLTNFPMGRMGRPREDIGGAVTALCGDQMQFINGQSIVVDGGLYTAL